MFFFTGTVPLQHASKWPLDCPNVPPGGSILASFQADAAFWSEHAMVQVFCNGQDEHLAMVLVGTAACPLVIFGWPFPGELLSS